MPSSGQAIRTTPRLRACTPACSGRVPGDRARRIRSPGATTRQPAMIEAPAAPPVTPAIAFRSGGRTWPTWLADAIGVLACCAAALLALVPLAGPRLVATHDGLLHVQRLIALDAALR